MNSVLINYENIKLFDTGNYLKILKLVVSLQRKKIYKYM